MSLLGIIVLAAVDQIGVGLAGPVVVDDVTKDTELLFVFLIHRHGDRTPEDLESTKTFSTNPDAVIAAENYYGFGQLSKQGKQRSYRLGQFIRNRYDGFIAPKFNDSEIYLESTAYTRTRMTLLTALAAVYPPVPGDSWSDSINWVPVPYKSNDATYDPNMAIKNCPAFLNYLTSALYSSSETMAPYFELLAKVQYLLNLPFNLQEQPIYAFSVYDVLRSQINLGIPVTEEMENLLPELEEAAGVAINILFGNLDNISYMSGVLLKEFFDYSTALLNGQVTPRLRWYSAHDISVYSFETILQLYPKRGVPKYNALLSLELRKDYNGKLFVLPVYVPSPEEEPLYLQVQGCDNVKCSLEQFNEILSPYTLDLSTWRNKCNWVETL